MLDLLSVGCEYGYANTSIKRVIEIMLITFVQFLQLFDPYLIFFGRRIILFHRTHEHTKHQSAENLHFGFCYHEFPSITNTKSL